MAQKLEAGVKDVFRGENYKAYLDFCAKMPRYSVNNQILIMMQKPDATMCQSFTGWKEMGRFVKKGEKGIRVMAPAPYKMEREQDKIGADGKPVLDKDGEPVPRLGVEENRIAIQEGMSEGQTVKTAFHEASHAIGSIRSFLKRRRMPMLNTERLKRRTKNFRWQNTIWSGSWISRKKNKNKNKNNKAKADSRYNSLGVFHRN